MVGIPICLSSFSKPNLDHSVFSSKLVDKPIISCTEWFIAIGATKHLVITTHFFSSMHVVHNVIVNLPDGQSVVFTYIGSIQPISTLLLIDV
jgi:hypothetical protein